MSVFKNNSRLFGSRFFFVYTNMHEKIKDEKIGRNKMERTFSDKWSGSCLCFFIAEFTFECFCELIIYRDT